MTEGNLELIHGLTREQTDAFMDALFDRRVRAHIVWAVRSTAPDGQLSFKDCIDENAGREWIKMLDGLAAEDDPQYVGRVHEVVWRPVVAGAWQSVEAPEAAGDQEAEE